METEFLIELSDEQQEIIAGGGSFSDLAKEATNECEDAQKLIADAIFGELPSQIATAYGIANDAFDA
jgi:hypothetical protein